MNLPKALEQEQDAAVKFTEEKNKIYDVDWRTIAKPFVDKDSKTDKSMQATSVLLLEDLSLMLRIEINRLTRRQEQTYGNDRPIGKHKNN